MYIFLDESGQLKYSPKKKNYFIIALVSAQRTKIFDKLIRKSKLAKIPRSQKHFPEIKAIQVSDKFKKYFYAHFAKIETEIFAIILNTAEIPVHLREKTDLVYLRLVIELLKKCQLQKESEIHLFLDKRSFKGLTHQALNSIIKEHFGPSFKRKTRFEINHVDSTNSKGLQVADMICYAFYQKYQRKNSQFYKIIKNKIKKEILAPKGLP